MTPIQNINYQIDCLSICLGDFQAIKSSDNTNQLVKLQDKARSLKHDINALSASAVIKADLLQDLTLLENRIISAMDD